MFLKKNHPFLWVGDVPKIAEQGFKGQRLYTAIFLKVVSPAVLVDEVLANAGDVSMGIPVFPIH